MSMGYGDSWGIGQYSRPQKADFQYQASVMEFITPCYLLLVNSIHCNCHWLCCRAAGMVAEEIDGI